MKKPIFIVIQNSSKGLILALPYEAHTIQVIIARYSFLNYFKLRDISDADFVAWAQSNIVPLSQIAWFLYDQRQFKERMVARSLVRHVVIEIEKFTGWTFVGSFQPDLKDQANSLPEVRPVRLASRNARPKDSKT